MPYIDEESREQLDGTVDQLVDLIQLEAGDNSDAIWGMLNYTISVLLHRTVITRFGEWRYHLMNGVMGVLESVKAEFYRRVVQPYEEMKMIVAGDLKEYKGYRAWEEHYRKVSEEPYVIDSPWPLELTKA